MTASRTDPPNDEHWTLSTLQESVFNWQYGSSQPVLKGLYDKGKSDQWDASRRIDWSTELFADNPIGLPDEMTPLYGTAIWAKLNGAERAELRRHSQAWQMSQFLHGEQGALLCAARVVQQSDSYDAKAYAATQVMDEARHVEIYTRLLNEKFGFSYPISPSMKSLLETVITHKEWDFVYLGMQVVIEGLALATFQIIRDHATNPLATQINTFVMQDEARHVAFGRLALRDYYGQLERHERREREDFLIEACRLMRDRLFPDEVWERVNLDRRQCKMEMENSIHAQFFRHQLFSRIVPTVRDIGLWGPEIRAAYAAMGIDEYARATTTSQLERDEQRARELQRAMPAVAEEI